MSNQIERLQAQFYSLNIEQKRDFIENLQDEVHYSSDQEWRAYIQPFISRCIREYNEELKRPTTAAAPAATYEATKYCTCGFQPVGNEKFCVRCGQPIAPGTSPSATKTHTPSTSQGVDTFNVSNARMAYENSRNSPPLPALAEGEQVVQSYHCIKKGLIFQANGFLTVTNKRILFQGHSMFTNATTEVPLESVGIIDFGVVKFSFIHLILSAAALIFAFTPWLEYLGTNWETAIYIAIAIIFGVIAFWPRCSLSIKATDNAGSPPILLNAILRNKSNFTLKGRPGQDTFRMFQELGAVIADLKNLGDAGVHKWSR